MRNTLVMLLIMGMAASPFASAQARPLGEPRPASSTVMSGNVTHPITAETVPDANADPAVAHPVVAHKRGPVKAKAEETDNAAKVRPDDPNKNPYWEPRDWNYIAEQGP